MLTRQVFCYPAALFCGCCMTQKGKEYVSSQIEFTHQKGRNRTNRSSVLGYPVYLNQKVSNMVPI